MVSLPAVDSFSGPCKRFGVNAGNAPRPRDSSDGLLRVADAGERTLAVDAPSDSGVSAYLGGHNLPNTVAAIGEGFGGATLSFRGPATIAPESRTPPLPGAPPESVRYRFGEVLGRGGFGEVIAAVQVSLGRKVAVKRLRRRVSRSPLDSHPEERADAAPELAFHQEALLTANLTHPNIVPVYDMSPDEDGEPLLAMKLVRGHVWSRALAIDFATMDVESYLAKHLNILLQVSQAVAFAHSLGIVHRDIKPAQVMLGNFGEVQLMDWGLALVYDEELLPKEAYDALGDYIPSRLTAPSPAGTPNYMAPEQTLDIAKDVGPRTDVYLLGGLLYTILTGEPPHHDMAGIQDLARIREQEIIPPPERQPGRFMPPDLVEAAMIALQPDPELRYPTARDFIAAIEEHNAGAHRRRESLAITERVAESLESSRGDYREHSQNLALLASAEAMWAGNHLVPELRERILAAFVRDAIANRDFTLARLHLDIMAEEGVDRAALEGSLAKAIHAYKDAKQRRTQIAWSVAILLAALLVIGALRDHRMSAEIESLRKIVAERPAK